MDRLKGKIAIVTGTASEIGLTIAKRFIEEGAKVLTADIDDERGAAGADTLGDDAVYCHLDVREAADWQAAIERAEALWGPVTILVNNAASIVPRGVEETDPAEFEDQFRTNMLGPLLGMQAVIPGMESAGGGAIVNVGSCVAMHPIAKNLAYVGTKWGLRGMTRTAALDVADRNIRVNSLHPGVIAAGMGQGADRAENAQAIRAMVPAGRTGSAEEVANMAVFLASEEARYCVGGEYSVDGGYATGGGRAPAEVKSR